MISLFGRREFDPPGAQMQDPRTALKVSGIWVLVSVFWIAPSIARMSHFWSSGRALSVWREASVWFWGVMLLFWLGNGWNNFRKYRAERKVV